MSFTLRKHPRFPGRPGPVLVAVMDGVGFGARDESDAVFLARTPALDRLWTSPMHCTLRAHGKAVGMPSDGDMGNSEVGHNALGCGRIYDQGAKLVAQALGDGRLFQGESWKTLVARCLSRGSAMHFIGLLSDGNVHSHIDHLFALLERAAAEGVKPLYVHGLLDGRDVPSTSALEYVDLTEGVLAKVGGKIASGGGRMRVTMDRYQADWSIVKRGWDAHVLGIGRPFRSATEAITSFRAEQPGLDDQNLPGFVIVDHQGQPVGRVRDGDSVVLFNFRGDRAIEISRAFDEGPGFQHFDRGPRPDVAFAGMMQYDGDFGIPRHYLVPPPAISRTMSEYLVRNQVPQLAISETQKYGHVTYFWNGNRGGKFDDQLESYVEIRSDTRPVEERPWMKAAEITDRLIDELRTGRHRFARVNFANGDMVGHTGHRDASIAAVEAVDMQIARLVRATEELGGILIVTADHGNADEMYQHEPDGHVQRSRSGVPVVKTSHTLNPVPFSIYDPLHRDGEYQVDRDQAGRAGLANVTATCLNLLGFDRPDDQEPGLLGFS